MDLSEIEIDESIYDAMLLSVDVAHALHPNKKEKMDITNKPVMGKGFWGGRAGAPLMYPACGGGVFV